MGLLAFAAIASACGSDDETNFPGGTGTTTGTGGGTTTGTTTSTSSSVGGGGQGGDNTGGSGAGEPVADPNLDGPYTITEIDDSTTVAATGNDVPIHCAYPTAGPSAGPYPVVVVAHGFQIPPTQYYGYVRRLATHGFVALTADFPAGFVSANHVENARDVLGALDWAAQAPALAGKANADLAGATGHSLGGKVSLLAATFDTRIKATITLDPVDSSMNCSPQDCPDVSDLMPLSIPTGFLGETIDAAGGFQSCAPAADNYTTFYAGTTSPSIEVTVTGANHMSFLDDVAGCGFICSVCNQATADNATVNALSRAYVTAFYRRYLKNDPAYDAYLTGAEAQARYVATNQVTIQSK